MRSLTLKLTLAFLAISLISVALVAVFARWITVQEFDRFVLDQAQNDFIDFVTAYYEANGSWQGMAQQLPQQPPPASAAGPAPLPHTGMLPAPPQFALVNSGGRVVVPLGQYRIGQQVPQNQLERGYPLVINGQTVGTVLPREALPDREPEEERYLARTNQALLGAALGAAGVALLLGVWLARRLTGPLRELIRATRAMAQGQLGHQVRVRSQDELGELTRSFNQMSADLAQANAARQQMTADIAHDLRTPLSVIKGYTEALRDGVLPPNPETFEAMHQETEQLSLLIQDLRTLSLADAGELYLNRRPVPPQELLQRVAAAHRPQAHQMELALQVSVPPDLPAMVVDPERMVQVLGNLVSNALRYTPAGGRITLSAAQRGSGVELVVEDSGSGIAPEALPHIFDRFYRGDAAREAHEGESGLGLAIAKSLVELHGGTISVESTLGQGTRFTIDLSPEMR
jgi:signal transduction histidine kinase